MQYVVGGVGVDAEVSEVEFVVTPGWQEITKASLTITANDQTYVYNGQMQGEGDTLYADSAQIKKKNPGQLRQYVSTR